MNLLLIYLEYFKIGIFAIGGGLATLPFLFLMTQDRFTFIRQTGWLNMEQLGGFIAIAQCSPGAIGVNVAAQIGFQYSGIAGGIFASLGLVSPAILVICFVFRALQSLKESKAAEAVFAGLRPAATGLLTTAGWGVWRLALYNQQGTLWHEIIRWREGIVIVVIFVLMMKIKLHPVVFIALGAGAGIVFGF